MKVTEYGSGAPRVAIVGGVHGNEHIGVHVIEKLAGLEIAGSLKYIIANEEALQLNQRFVEADLNRSFPGKRYGNHEEKLADTLLKELSDADYVFDIHSTSVETPDFVITVGKNSLAQYFPLPKVVDMSGFAKGVSLIENVTQGISLEYADITSAKQVACQLQQCLVNLGLLKGSPAPLQQERYVVYKILEKTEQNKNITLENFVETELNGERFIPILYGEGGYPDILCLKARKVG
ncbi:MAG TPA: succinylglutamate desuccinylase/aspartoacylase family protein [Candidatus Nanoarchaeia archaeon]|nr:succinylglutamate desuccinylase/aspartoacylase family protein [Candidatus Nanoarchaeia archaeon]